MNDSDQSRYEALQRLQEEKWEALCGRCGACCGTFDGDPCEHLDKDQKGLYFCRIYENRFGLRKTRGGREFMCVPIRNILHQSWPGDECCGYKRKAHHV